MVKSLTSIAIKGSVISAAVFLIQFLLQFGAQFIFAIYIGPEEYGIFGMSFTIAMLIASFGYFQSDKYLIKQEEDVWSRFDAILTFQILWSITIGGISYFFLPRILFLTDSVNYYHYILYLWPVLLYNPLGIFRLMLEKEMRFAHAKFAGLAAQVIATVLGIYLAFSGFGILSLVVWKIIHFSVEVILTIALLGYRPKFSLKKQYIKEGMNFSFPIYLSGILVFFYYNIDYVVVNSVLSSKALGFYFFAFQISNFALKFRAVINSVLYPIYSKVEVASERKKWFLNASHILFLINLIPLIVIIIFGDYILPRFLSNEWYGAIMPIKIVLTASVLRSVFGNVTPYLYSLGITKSDLKVALINVVILPISVFIGAYYYNLHGACYGLLAGVFISIYLGCTYVNKRLIQITFWEIFKKGIPIVVLLLVWIFVGSEYTNSVFINFAFFGLICILYFKLFKDDIMAIKEVIQNRV